MTGTANTPRNMILNADCIQAMRSFDRGSVDFILTDPPYLVNYRDRNGRKVANDDNARWLKPAFNQMHRVLKDCQLPAPTLHLEHVRFNLDHIRQP